MRRQCRARRDAERTLGRDMDGVRRERVDAPRDLASGQHGERDLRVGRHRYRAETRPA